MRLARETTRPITTAIENGGAPGNRIPSAVLFRDRCALARTPLKMAGRGCVCNSI